MKTNHLYSVTISNLSVVRRENILRSLPSKYYDCYERADLIADCMGANCPVKNDSGSGEVYFLMDANLANALRKWFKRRFKGRSKFARTIVPVRFVDGASDALRAKGGVA